MKGSEKGSGIIALEENCPPTLIVSLTLTHTLNLTGRAIFLGGNCPDIHKKYSDAVCFINCPIPFLHHYLKMFYPTRFSKTCYATEEFLCHIANYLFVNNSLKKP